MSAGLPTPPLGMSILTDSKVFLHPSLSESHGYTGLSSDILYPHINDMRDIMSNIALFPWELLRAKPKGPTNRHPDGFKGIYMIQRRTQG